VTIRKAVQVLAFCAVSALATASAVAQQVRFETSEGAFVVKLEPEKAPKTVANFLDYVKAGHYAGTTFHRVIPNFMIQGGGFTPDMQQKPTKAPIPLESRNGLSNKRGTVAMARTGDPNSATAQFFVNVTDNPFLDQPSYAVFGEVVQGMDVVDRIRAVPTGNQGPFQNVPTKPVIITKATVEP